MKLKYLALTICLFLFSCGENIPPVDSSPETKILYLGNGTEPKDLDPHTVTGVPESKILMALIEGLVIRHPSGLPPIPLQILLHQSLMAFQSTTCDRHQQTPTSVLHAPMLKSQRLPHRPPA